MRRLFVVAVTAGAAALCASSADPACCYFSALEKDVKQPGQRAFITWDPAEKIESFTVQPLFEGNAEDFGMVVPTPAQPKLAEMHKDLFKTLAVYTILKPMDVKKFKPRVRALGGGAKGGVEDEKKSKDKGVKVLEAGVVGSLDYKVIEATNAQGLFDWLKENKYSYSGDKATLEFYVEKKWFFTVMKIDPKQMKKRPDGTYLGEVTPTRFTFESEKLIYPLRITKISVKDKTDALFYIQAPEKMDLPGKLSYQLSFQTMWGTAFSFANWELCTPTEKDWWEHVKEKQQELQKELAEWQQKNAGRVLSTLEWSRRITDEDLKVITGEAKFDREAPEEEIKKLATLSGIVRKGQFVTKCRHVFLKDEMDEDLVFVEASFKGKKDSVEHVEILPTSPP
jgi:hypothetical protein